MSARRPPTLETRWKHNGCFPPAAIPGDLYGWLLDPASLTKRLQQLCHGNFRVRVISQQRGRPRTDEMRALGAAPGTQAIVRQVQLLCNDGPWVFARTVIPVTSLSGRLQRLAHLGTRPLGAMLFADPGMRRGCVELARIRPGESLHAEATSRLRGKRGDIWGRRSVFRIQGKPLLVSEIFLPGFPAGGARMYSRQRKASRR